MKEKMMSYIDHAYFVIRTGQEEKVPEGKTKEIHDKFSSYIDDVYEIINDSSATEDNADTVIKKKIMSYVDHAYSIIREKQEEKVSEGKTKEIHDKFPSYIDDVYETIKDSLATKDDVDTVMKNKIMRYVDHAYAIIREKQEEKVTVVKTKDIHDKFSSYIDDVYETIKDYPATEDNVDTLMKKKIMSYIDHAYAIIREKQEEKIPEGKTKEIHDKLSSYIDDVYEIIKDSSATEDNVDTVMKKKIMSYVDHAYAIIREKQEEKVPEGKTKEIHDKFPSHIDDVYNDLRRNKEVQFQQKKK